MQKKISDKKAFDYVIISDKKIPKRTSTEVSTITYINASRWTIKWCE